jgi:hypothetical protein
MRRKWFYVHRYGNWHIAEGAGPKALCGAVPQLAHWNSHMRFRDYDPRIEADDRQVCWQCLLILGEVMSANTA